LAERIQRETREQVRLPLSVGVATNKLVSETAVKAERLGGSAAALESLFEVLAGNEASFLAPLSVEVLPDVPDPMRERLDEYQLELIGEIAALREQQACAVFGPPGRQLVARARGIDPRPVLPPALKAEFTVAHTLSSDSNDLGLLHTLLRRMSEILGRRLRTRHLVSRRLVLELHYTDYQLGRYSLPLRPALLDIELWDAARRAFTLANSRPVAVRAVTMTVDRLLEAEPQLDLFEMNSRPTQRAPEKAQSLQRAIDSITTRWGKKGLLRGGNGAEKSSSRRPRCSAAYAVNSNPQRIITMNSVSFSPRPPRVHRVLREELLQDSPNQYQFPKRLVRLHGLVRGGNLRHREHRSNHRLELAGREVREHVPAKRGDNLHALLGRTGAHDRSEDFEPFPEQRREIGADLGTLEKREHDHAAQRRQHRQIVGPGRTAQYVDDDIDRLADLVAESGCGRGDGSLESQLLRPRQFFPAFATCRGNARPAIGQSGWRRCRCRCPLRGSGPARPAPGVPG
jgi:nucleotidyltransferase/DNA polymerase involved in DNA repair